MLRKIEKEMLKLVAKCAGPIIVDWPGCMYYLHQPKRPESLRKCVNDKKASK